MHPAGEFDNAAALLTVGPDLLCSFEVRCPLRFRPSPAAASLDCRGHSTFKRERVGVGCNSKEEAAILLKRSRPPLSLSDHSPAVRPLSALADDSDLASSNASHSSLTDEQVVLIAGKKKAAEERRTLAQAATT